MGLPAVKSFFPRIRQQPVGIHHLVGQSDIFVPFLRQVFPDPLFAVDVIQIRIRQTRVAVAVLRGVVAARNARGFHYASLNAVVQAEIRHHPAEHPLARLPSLASRDERSGGEIVASGNAYRLVEPVQALYPASCFFYVFLEVGVFSQVGRQPPSVMGFVVDDGNRFVIGQAAVKEEVRPSFVRQRASLVHAFAFFDFFVCLPHQLVPVDHENFGVGLQDFSVLTGRQETEHVVIVAVCAGC